MIAYYLFDFHDHVCPFWNGTVTHDRRVSKQVRAHTHKFSILWFRDRVRVHRIRLQSLQYQFRPKDSPVRSAFLERAYSPDSFRLFCSQMKKKYTRIHLCRIRVTRVSARDVPQGFAVPFKTVDGITEPTLRPARFTVNLFEEPCAVRAALLAVFLFSNKSRDSSTRRQERSVDATSQCLPE